MKKITLCFVIILVAFLVGCGGGGDDASEELLSGNFGSFAGNIQVVDDPQTELGRIFNSRVTVSKAGSNALVTVTGDSGFSREFTGSIRSDVKGAAGVDLLMQTRPFEKNVGGSVSIVANELAISIEISDDAVTVKDSVGAEPFEISGKLSLIGTNMIRE